MFAISTTVNGGWRGGIIIPLFFIGACLGKAIAIINPASNETLAMICVMAALNSTVTRTPISTTLLLAKLTGFSTFTPILFASLVGFFLAPRSPFIGSQRKWINQTARIPLIARCSGEKYVQFASVESQGFCHYKCTNGIKQHLAVNTSQLAVFYPLHKSQCVR